MEKDNISKSLSLGANGTGPREPLVAALAVWSGAEDPGASPRRLHAVVAMATAASEMTQTVSNMLETIVVLSI